MSALIPAVTAALVLGLTYLFCWRPMRQQRGRVTSSPGSAAVDLDLELARAEIELLKLQQLGAR